MKNCEICGEKLKKVFSLPRNKMYYKRDFYSCGMHLYLKSKMHLYLKSKEFIYDREGTRDMFGLIDIKIASEESKKIIRDYENDNPTT